jgi:hypothetical protein
MLTQKCLIVLVSSLLIFGCSKNTENGDNIKNIHDGAKLKSEFNFDGMTKSSTLKDVKSRFKYLRLKETDDFVDLSCGPYSVSCQASENLTIFNLPVTSANFSFNKKSDKLSFISLYFDAYSFKTVKENLIQMHGQPTDKESSPLSKIIGINPNHEVLIWENVSNEMLKLDSKDPSLHLRF